MIGNFFLPHLISSKHSLLYIYNSGFIVFTLLIIVALIAIYFILNKNKTKVDFLTHSFTKEIDKLKNEKEALQQKVNGLNEKLEQYEKEELVWQKEKDELTSEIKDLKEELKKLQKKEAITDDNNIIIEYYMNDKPPKK